jgi:hypothetical protein
MKLIGLRLLPIALAGIICWITCLGITSCRQYATASDKEAIARLQQKWGPKYDLELTSEIYWKVKLKPNVALNEDELRTIFNQFIADRSYPDTVFVYMNVYDAGGRFIVQLFRDRDGKIQKSDVEYVS